MRRNVLLFILLLFIIPLCSGMVYAADGVGAQVEVNRIIETFINATIGYCLVSSLCLIVELMVLKKFENEDNFLCKLFNILIAIGGVTLGFVPLVAIIIKQSSKEKNKKVIINVALVCFMLLAALVFYLLAWSGRAHNVEVMPE